jgi:hypothetical protein
MATAFTFSLVNFEFHKKTSLNVSSWGFRLPVHIRLQSSEFVYLRMCTFLGFRTEIM